MQSIRRCEGGERRWGEREGRRRREGRGEGERRRGKGGGEGIREREEGEGRGKKEGREGGKMEKLIKLLAMILEFLLVPCGTVIYISLSTSMKVTY